MPDEPPTPSAAALLDYAAPPPAREPWGPLLFRPSGRSLVLLILLAGAAAWVALRHDPWRRVGTIPGDMAVGPPFTRDGLILTFDSRAGTNLYDPATARLVRNVLPTVDPNTYRYFVLGGGERILALPYTERVALVYDVSSGRVVDRLPNPDGLGSQLFLVAPDGGRMLTIRNGRIGGVRTSDRPPEVRYWDLTRTPPATRPAHLAPFGSDPEFSPDGRRILQTGLVAGDWRLLDGHTMDVVAGGTDAVDTPIRAGFHGSQRFWLQWTRKPGATTTTRRPVSDWYELRAAETGALLATMPVPPALSAVFTSAFAMTDDAGAWALVAPPSSRTLAGWTGETLHVAETATGRVLLSRDGCTLDWNLLAFPGPAAVRFLAGDLATRRLAVFAPPHTQPLAVLPGPGPLPGQGFAHISPDGRTILARTNPGPAALPVATSVLAVYRPAGWDCPESRWGALAFPHTWLTLTLFSLLALSLTTDARRVRRHAARRDVSGWLVAGLLAVTVPLTIHALLAALLGRWVRTPAPLLLLLTILLATHARAWRAIAIVALCALIPLLAWHGNTLRGVGLSATIPFHLLDRSYDVPTRLPLAALSVLILLVLSGIYLLVRPCAELR